MNPVLEAEVCFKPNVCSTYPLNRQTPANSAGRQLWSSLARWNSLRKMMARAAVAIVKRIVKKSSVEVSARARLTSTKVVPQMNATPIRLRSTAQPGGRVWVILRDGAYRRLEVESLAA